MILLDTDHFSALQIPAGARRDRLRARMTASPDQHFAVTAITLEEQLPGLLAEIAATPDAARQVGAYQRLVDLVRFFGAWEIVAFDDAAAVRSAALRKARVRIGTMDLKIASIAVAQDVLLLTANARDFGMVHGLRFANWMD
jgi:tRNA(fMet)-specific endonuclease VapC